MVRLPFPCLVVLVGPSGAGKSTWAAANFRPGQVVASDDLRAIVGEGPDDQRAGNDAFELLDLILERRLRRRLLTVVDTLGLDAARRRGYVALARRYGVACHAVVWDTPADVCRARNRERGRPVPTKVLASQIRAWEAAQVALSEESFDGVHQPGPVEIVPVGILPAPAFAARQREAPMTMQFGLQLPSFTWEGGPEKLASRLEAIAHETEEAGFSSLWVMDHFLQIPLVGREWQEMLESYTTLGFLAAHTTTVRVGTLVTGVTYRNVAHLAKIIATLDVLSGGRAICGIGAAWYEREHRAYGWPFPKLSERFALLEDALQLLPLMWGPGSPAFEGKLVSVPEAMCYPRPLQEKVPILVGGSGERRTLALVARYADACNLFGDAATVRRKLEVLARHCDAIGRPTNEIEVTQLSTALVAVDRRALDEAVERLRPSAASPEAFAARVNAATVEDHTGRFRELAEAGVQTAIVSLPDVDDHEAIPRFAEVINAFR
ncbi:MAG TPA: TIGR03560 family F420-dependent LLM class oxidoreductase [Acidimicrobiales bacterium]|nr:TIGR03560 family F420-dependent LLM class oxidoreductase [Acidimicrobiales bacterium]